jgi:hypothetical protein
MNKASPTPFKNVQAYLPEHTAIRREAVGFRVPSPVVVGAMWMAWSKLSKTARERLLIESHRRRPNLQGNRVQAGAAS